MRSPTITLLTDFGTRDVFVGVMKGVIRGIAPTATVIDLTHEVPPQDVEMGGHYLRMSWSYFPAGTVHVAVVDPGVGTGRRAIAVSCEDHLFVAPDNGLLGPLLQGREWHGVELSNADYQLSEASRTFHGRDIFAPAGAHLAAGVSLTELGPGIDDLQPASPLPPAEEDEGLHGRIWWIDHFGNMVSSITSEQLSGVGTSPRIRIGGCTIKSLSESYGESVPGEVLALINSFGYLEVAVNQGNASERLGLSRGAEITVQSG